MVYFVCRYISKINNHSGDYISAPDPLPSLKNRVARTDRESTLNNLNHRF